MRFVSRVAFSFQSLTFTSIRVPSEPPVAMVWPSGLKRTTSVDPPRRLSRAASLGVLVELSRREGIELKAFSTPEMSQRWTGLLFSAAEATQGPSLPPTVMQASGPGSV